MQLFPELLARLAAKTGVNAHELEQGATYGLFGLVLVAGVVYLASLAVAKMRKPHKRRERRTE